MCLAGQLLVPVSYMCQQMHLAMRDVICEITRAPQVSHEDMLGGACTPPALLGRHAMSTDAAYGELPDSLSCNAGGVVLVLIVAAVTAVSGFDPVARK